MQGESSEGQKCTNERDTSLNHTQREASEGLTLGHTCTDAKDNLLDKGRQGLTLSLTLLPASF